MSLSEKLKASAKMIRREKKADKDTPAEFAREKKGGVEKPSWANDINK